MLAIDTSGSMAATDVNPSRLVAAQDAARRFISGLPAGLKIGLLQFDTTARVLVAPTSDHTSALAAVNALAIGGGTDTGDAINDALDAVVRAAGGRRRVEGPGRRRAHERRFTDDRIGRAVAAGRRSRRRRRRRRRRRADRHDRLRDVVGHGHRSRARPSPSPPTRRRWRRSQGQRREVVHCHHRQPAQLRLRRRSGAPSASTPSVPTSPSGSPASRSSSRCSRPPPRCSGCSASPNAMKSQAQIGGPEAPRRMRAIEGRRSQPREY